MAGEHTHTRTNQAEEGLRSSWKRCRHQAVVQHELGLVKAIGSIAIRWKIIPGDDIRLEEVVDTAVLEVLVALRRRDVRQHIRPPSLVVPSNLCVCVFITAGSITKRRIVEDMCYKIRRAEACVD